MYVYYGVFIHTHGSTYTYIYTLRGMTQQPHQPPHKPLEPIYVYTYIHIYIYIYTYTLRGSSYPYTWMYGFEPIQMHE
jgi:hypothetical protein